MTSNNDTVGITSTLTLSFVPSQRIMNNSVLTVRLGPWGSSSNTNFVSSIACTPVTVQLIAIVECRHIDYLRQFEFWDTPEAYNC
mgnify:FL=1